MTRPNPKNERIKREYITFMKEARGYAEASIDKAVDSIHSFEEHIRFADFKKFSLKWATSFKRAIAEQKNRSGHLLSKATVSATMRELNRFFHWLAEKPGFRSRISHMDAEHFRLSARDENMARATRPKNIPTLEQVEQVLASMPHHTDVERRDRALIALLTVTGARVSAVATLRLKDIDIAARVLFQDGRHVDTKFGKTFHTSFFPVGEYIRSVVEEWVNYLRSEKLWGPDDPLLPATLVKNVDGRFRANGLGREFWKCQKPIENAVKAGFLRAGLPATTPHLFRDLLVLLGERVCRSPEELKAWSQNLGHERVTTTLTSYGRISPERQSALIQEIGRRHAGQESPEMAMLRSIAARLGAD